MTVKSVFLTRFDSYEGTFAPPLNFDAVGNRHVCTFEESTSDAFRLFHRQLQIPNVLQISFLFQLEYTFAAMRGYCGKLSETNRINEEKQNLIGLNFCGQRWV